MRWTYEKIVVKKYWNGYRTYYRHGNGNLELLHVAVPSKEDAYKLGVVEVDLYNEEIDEAWKEEAKRYPAPWGSEEERIIATDILDSMM